MEHHVSAATDVAVRARRYYKRGGGWPVCVSAESERCVVVDVVKAWREREKVGFSEWKGRSAPGWE